MAAPVGGEVLSEVLPYLELQKDNEKEEEKIEKVVVPELRNKTIKEAESSLKELGLVLKINEVEDIARINKEKTIIKEQLPKPGIKIISGASIYVDI